MSGPTPDQRRKIERLVQEFDEYWYVDGKTKEIRLKPFLFAKKVRNLIWKKRFTVFALYHWAKRKWLLQEFNCFRFPIHHDNMPIEGFPIKYELWGGWSIPKRELAFLTGGPLAAEGLYPILVPALIGWQRFVYWFKQLAPLVVGSITIIGTLVRYWEELVSLVGYVL